VLARKGKGKEAKLCYSANALAENRNTLLIDLQVERPTAAPSGVPQWQWPMSGWRALFARRQGL
jgi:hypothetical protein